MQGEPPYDAVDGVSLSRATFTKTFNGPLSATSTVQMLAARTPKPTSAGYVALERTSGTMEIQITDGVHHTCWTTNLYEMGL